MKNFKKQIVIVFLLAFIVAFTLAAYGDLQKVGLALLNVPFWLIPACLVFTTLNYLLRFLRWQFLLGQIGISSHELPVKKSLLIFLSGLAMTITPGKVGEILKSYLIKKEIGNRFAETAPLIIIERLTDGLGMIILMSVGLLQYKYGVLPVLTALAVCLLFILFIQNQKLCNFFLQKIGREQLKIFYKNSVKLLSVKNLIITVSLSTLSWLMEAASLSLIILVVAHKFFFAAGAFIFSFASFLGFASLLPAGLGVAEGSLTGLLQMLIGLDKTPAVVITLILRATTLWFGVFVGLISLLLISRSKSKITV